MKPREAIDYLFKIKYILDVDTKALEALRTLDREIETPRPKDSELYVFLLSQLAHYSEEIGKAEESGDESRRTIMASKQNAIFDVLAQKF